MTKEQIKDYIKKNEEIEKMLHRFMRHNDNIITSDIEINEEEKMHIIFMNAYRKEVKKLTSEIDINSEAFKEYVREEGISDFIEAKKLFDLGSDNLKYNPLSDPSITKEQRKGLEEFHRWLNRNCEKTGFLGDKEGGGMRDFVNRFMSQPASVQLKALYLLETGKRKSPDVAGFDDFNSQMNYVPSLSNLKKPLISFSLKIWERASGKQFYWNKLNQSLNIAEKSKDKLEAFRKDLRHDLFMAGLPNSDEENINGYSKLNSLKAFGKLIDAEKVEKPYKDPETKEISMVKDEYYSPLVACCKEAAKMAEKLPIKVKAKDREAFAENALNTIKIMLPQLKYKDEGRKVAKGTWGLGKDIIAQKENYQNIERIFKSALALHINENKQLGKTPGIVGYLNSNKSFIGDLPSNLFDGLNLTGELVNIVSSLKNLRTNYNNTNKMQKLTGTLDFASNISDGIYHVSQMLASAGKIMDNVSESDINDIKTFSTSVAGVTGAITTSKSAVNTIKFGVNRSKASKAVKLAESSNFLTKDEKKRIKDISDFSHAKNVKSQRGAIRGMIKGAGLTTVSLGGASLAAVPFVGPIMLASIAGTSICDKVMNERGRKDIARLAVEKLITGSDKMANKIRNHTNRILARISNYKYGDKTAEKLKKFLAKNKVADRSKNEEAVKAGHTSLFTCVSGATNAVADELLKKVYLANPEEGYKENNIITSSKDHEYYRNERISYKELLESMGVKVRYKSQVVDAKKFERRVQEKKLAQLGS